MRFWPLEEVASSLSAPWVHWESETLCGWSPCGQITFALGTLCVLGITRGTMRPLPKSLQAHFLPFSIFFPFPYFYRAVCLFFW